MGKPNFNFQKRQKELAKKKKSEEKDSASWKKTQHRPRRIRGKLRPRERPNKYSGDARKTMTARSGHRISRRLNERGVMTYGSFTAWSKEGSQEAEEQEEVIPAGRGVGRGPRLEALRSGCRHDGTAQNLTPRS